jgi:hypothetical protein
VGGLLAAGPALYDVFTLNDQFLSAASEAGIPDAVARDALESGRLVISVAPGLWVVVFAGVLGMVAALLAVLWAPIPSSSGTGLRGWQAPTTPIAPPTPGSSPSGPPSRPDAPVGP